MGYSIDPCGRETAILHDLVDFDDADVIEVGCGDGRLTWRYAADARSVVALDPNAEKIARAIGATPPSLESKVTFVVADVNQLQLSPASFDVAILSYSL